MLKRTLQLLRDPGWFADRLRDRVAPGDHEAIFSRVHRRRRWGDGESVSGPGSAEARAASFRGDLVAALQTLEVRVLLDAPCGDFNWTAPVADAVERYVGVDVVRPLVEANTVRHAAPGREFRHLDITRDPLPAADAILCRDGLVHFASGDIWAALGRFRATGARYLVTTSFPGRRANPEIRTGGWRPLNLEAAPFHFPRPLLAIDERCTHTGGIYRDKILAVWPMLTVPVPREEAP
jgi:hypothetical protein